MLGCPRVNYAIPPLAETTGGNEIHLHLGKAGENGPVVVVLEDFEEPLQQEDFTVFEIISGGRVLEADGVNNIASLFQAVRRGEIYVDIHSERFPEGAARGQIFSRH